MGRGWQIMRLFGIPIFIDFSWLLILLLLSWSLSMGYQQTVAELDPGFAWLLGLGTALAFFACILLHEMGHALVARQQGIPIRGITLFLFGGVAQLEEEPPSAVKELLMALAGPAVTVVLIGIFGVLWLFGLLSGWDPILLAVLGYLAGVNLAVLIFNMVPAFPLDGGRVLRAILWSVFDNLRRATYWASVSGQVFAWTLIGLGVLTLISGGPPFTALWLGLIGLFLNAAARMGYQQVVIREALQGEPVRKFMSVTPITVSPTMSLREWVDDVVYRYHHKLYPVSSNGHIEGFVTTRSLNRIPREEWGEHTVAELMDPECSKITISPESDALEAFEKMQRSGCTRLLVMEGGQLVGILSLKDLLRFLQLKLELEGEEQGGGREAHRAPEPERHEVGANR